MVEPQHDVESEAARSEVGKFKKQELAKTGLSLKQNMQASWIRRYAGGSRESWRQTKLHRVAARRWLANLDTQIRRATPLRGLSHWKRENDSVSWGHWSRWPHFGLTFDLGSDGNSGYHALERRDDFKLNCDKDPDPCHGANRSTIWSLQQADLWAFWLCMLIAWNVEFGTNTDDLRGTEIRECLRNTTAAAWETNLLFTFGLEGLAKCFRRLGNTFDSTQRLEPQVWSLLQQRSWWVRTGYRANTCRFMALVAVPKQRVPSWEIDLFEATTLALDQDYLKGEMSRHRLLLRASTADVDGAGSTYSGRITLEDRTLRNAVQNALGIRYVLYSDNMNRRICHSVFQPLCH